MCYKNEKIAYVRCSNRKFENYIGRMSILYRKCFNKIEIENIYNGNIICLPNEIKNINPKIIQKINLCIKENKIEYVILENEMEFIKEKLENVKIINGKYLMKNCVIKILKYIIDISKSKTQLESVYIFVNDYTKNNITIIKELSEKFKSVNIITENLKIFKRLEEELYKKEILITVSNNKKKSAKNAKYIINIDFDKELFEKYNINMESIIINLTNNECFFNKIFRGKIINYISLKLNEDLEVYINEYYGNYDKLQFLEGVLINRNFEDIIFNLGKNNIEIDGLIGLRGVINEKEFVVTA